MSNGARGVYGNAAIRTRREVGHPGGTRKAQRCGKPYFRVLDQGLHLGYRKLKGAPGRWVVRYYVGEQSYVVETSATADDFRRLTTSTCSTSARPKRSARPARRPQTNYGWQGPLHRRRRGGTAPRKAGGQRTQDRRDMRFRAASMILPECQAGRGTHDRRHTQMVYQARDYATAGAHTTGKCPAIPNTADDPEAERRRRSTANRLLAILRAALTTAFREGKVSSDQRWRRVQPFENVASARIRYLKVAEAQRLINAWTPTLQLGASCPSNGRAIWGLADQGAGF